MAGGIFRALGLSPPKRFDAIAASGDGIAGSAPRVPVAANAQASITKENINRVPGIQKFLGRLSKANVSLTDLGLTEQALLDMANRNPDGFVAELNKRLDVREARARQVQQPPIPRGGKVDAPHAVVLPEKSWNRIEALGATPGKDSPVGQKVIARMRSAGLITGTPPNLSVYHPPTGKWYPISACDMGHTMDAVRWWNKEGHVFGAKSDRVRQWMSSPDIYELQPRGWNRSAGAKIGETYTAPHPDPITPEELGGAVKPRDAQGRPIVPSKKTAPVPPKPAAVPQGTAPKPADKPLPPTPAVPGIPPAKRPLTPPPKTPQPTKPSGRGSDARGQALAMMLDSIRTGLDKIADQNARDEAETWLSQNRARIVSELFKRPGCGMWVVFSFTRNGDVLQFQKAVETILPSRPPEPGESREVTARGVGCGIWIPPVRRDLPVKPAPAPSSDPTHTQTIIVDTREKLMNVLPHPNNAVASYYLLKEATLEMGAGYVIRLGAKVYGVHQGLRDALLAAFQASAKEQVAARIFALAQRIHRGEADLVALLKKHGDPLSKFWLAKPLALLDPNAYVKPKRLCEEAKEAGGSGDFRAASRKLGEADALVEVAENDAYRFRTGVDFNPRE